MKSSKKRETRLIVATSEVDADILYATRFFAPDPFIYLEKNGKRTLVLSDLEIDRARKVATADEFVQFSKLERELQNGSKAAPSYEKVLAHFLKKRGVKSAIVPPNFPLGYARELSRARITVRPADGLFWPARASKTDTELRLMRHALRITEAGLARATEVLKASRPGPGKKLRWVKQTLTSEVLRAEIDSAVLRAGGTPTGTIVAGGDQACDPHERGSGPLRAHSLIIVDIFPRDAKTGYFGDLTRTFIKGRASEAQRKLWNTVKDGQELALRRIKAGVDGMTIHKAIQDLFAERGYKTGVEKGRRVGFFHGTGHGLGLEIHEYPRLQKVVLKAREVVTVEPGLYYPGLGGVRIEDVVAVTKTGHKMLSSFPKQLEV
jgi:Xaa-Pro aminopeptidase